MRTLVIRGPVLTQSGYGCHARQISRWALARQDVDVKFHATPWGDTPWLLNESYADGLIGQIMKKTVELTVKGDVSIQIQLPNEWDTSVAGFNVGVTAAVETDRCNPAWIDSCNKMNLVIVPSEHVKSCLANTGKVTIPLLVVPEAFNDSVVKETLPSLPEFSTQFNFLVFGQLTGNNAANDRKNTYMMIKWLCEEFQNSPDVGIVIKTNMGRNTLIDRASVKGVLTNVLAECRRGPYPKVHLLHGEMSDDEVAALYRHPQVKALVAATRGEGYGLPILEAAVSGLPVIATGWSGHMDFLKLGKFISLFYKLEEIHPSRVDANIFMKTSRWANVSEDDFKKRVSKFKSNPQTPIEWARELKPKLEERYSFAVIAKAYDEALGNVV